MREIYRAIFACQNCECHAEEKVPVTEQEILERIALFKAKGADLDLEVAYAAVDTTRAMDEDAVDLLRFKVIEAARGRLDKTYDVDHPPVMVVVVTPRRGDKRFKYDTGTPLWAVEDPEDRADFIKRRKENEELWAKHHQQVSIRQIWNSYTQFLEFRKKNGPKDPVFLRTAEVLRNALASSTLEAEDKKRLMDILQPNTPKPAK